MRYNNIKWLIIPLLSLGLINLALADTYTAILSKSQTALAAHQPQLALQNLKTISAKVDDLSIDEQIKYNTLLANSYEALKQPLNAIHTRINLDLLLTNPEASQANSKAILHLAHQLPTATLENLIADPSEPVLAGWAALALIVKQDKPGTAKMNADIEAWKVKFPDHPANALIKKQATTETKPVPVVAVPIASAKTPAAKPAEVAPAPVVKKPADSYKRPHYWVVSLEGGAGFLMLQDVNTIVGSSDPTTHVFHPQGLTDSPIYGGGVRIGYYFPVLGIHSFTTQWLPGVTAGLRLNYFNGSSKGQVQWNGPVNTHTFNYTMPVQSMALFAEAEATILRYKRFSWLGLIGVGAAQNQVSLQENNIDPSNPQGNLSFGSNTTTGLAYEIGTGVGYNITPDWRLTLSYRYLSLGNAQLASKADQSSPNPANNLPVTTSSFPLTSNNIMLGIDWNF